jgi:alkanesulfonate monooxygenase
MTIAAHETDLGIGPFILTGSPHLEECYRFAELMFPLRATTGNDLGPARNAGPFGEMIANVAAPTRRAAG